MPPWFSLPERITVLSLGGIPYPELRLVVSQRCNQKGSVRKWGLLRFRLPPKTPNANGTVDGDLLTFSPFSLRWAFPITFRYCPFPPSAFRCSWQASCSCFTDRQLSVPGVHPCNCQVLGHPHVAVYTRAAALAYPSFQSGWPSARRPVLRVHHCGLQERDFYEAVSDAESAASTQGPIGVVPWPTKRSPICWA